MRKTLYFFLFTFQFFLSSAQDISSWQYIDTTFYDDSDQISYLENEDGSESIYFYYDKNNLLQSTIHTTFRGETQHNKVINFHENGKVFEEYYQYWGNKGVIAKVYLDSTYSVYNEEGVLIEKENYKDGMLDGTLLYYYDSGELESEIEYTNDQRNGEYIQYYPNGERAALLLFNDDLLIEYAFFDKDGNELHNEPLINGSGKMLRYKLGEANGYCKVKKRKIKKCKCD
jgi:antitoxin component YwqK of YwqJK toxin-antitoxin module